MTLKACKIIRRDYYGGRGNLPHPPRLRVRSFTNTYPSSVPFYPHARYHPRLVDYLQTPLFPLVHGKTSTYNDCWSFWWPPLHGGSLGKPSYILSTRPSAVASPSLRAPRALRCACPCAARGFGGRLCLSVFRDTYDDTCKIIEHLAACKRAMLMNILLRTPVFLRYNENDCLSSERERLSIPPLSSTLVRLGRAGCSCALLCLLPRPCT